MKKSSRAKAPAAAKASAAKSAVKPPRELDVAPVSAPKSARFKGAIGAGAFLVVVGAVVAVMTMGPKGASEPAEAAAANGAADAAPQAQSQPAKPVRAIAGAPTRRAQAKARAAETPGAPKTAADLPDAVTLAGCLERTGDTFRMKDTSGSDAPKTRSWKSGFLKKSAAPVNVVDWNHRLKDHVGERISVSGMFVDGEMHVRTLRRVSATCN